MTRILIAVSAVASLATAPVLAQSAAPTPGTVVQSTTPVVLPPDKQNLIREQAKRPNLPVATLSEPARIDMVIPDEIELLALPQDVATETPATASYRYLITNDVIAVVEPQSRKVIQLISR